MVNLTSFYAEADNPNILGREKELDLLMMTLMRHEKPNAILHGQAGVGKTSIIHALAFLIANKQVPAPLQGFQVLEVSTNALIAGPGYRGVTEEKFENMIDEALATGKTILFFDEFHTVEHLGEMANGQTPGLGNTLKPFLTRPDFRVVGATTTAEMGDIKDRALMRRFFPILVPEPNDETVLLIIEACLKQYSGDIPVSEGVSKKILDLSKTYAGFNPDKAKDITDFLCSHAKLTQRLTIDVDYLSEFFRTYFSGMVKR
jgi:ATP-dependent Clp protease ATP-binding subunit ClpA